MKGVWMPLRPFIEPGEVYEGRVGDAAIRVNISADGTALQLVAAPGYLMEDPLGNRIKTTEFVVVPRVVDE